MYEWMLILTMHIQGPVGEIRDVATEVVPGFISEQACETAARQIAVQLIALVGKSRNRQGISGSSRKHEPSIYSKCIKVAK
jgi:hypothetical protein